MVGTRWFYSLAFTLVMVALSASAEAPFSFETTPGKLPKEVVPRHYAIRLQPDLEKLTTRGTVTVDLEVRKPVKEIVLNALDMTIGKVTLSGKREVALTPRLDEAKQLLVLSSANEIGAGKYKLTLDFSGNIRERAEGLFYVKYATASGKKMMLSTQMEPTDARRMFPCWDEPVFRATYELTVVVPEKQMAVSNTPVEREKRLGDGLKEVKFGRTPAMASYLMVLVSGELEALEDTVDGVKVRIVTTEGNKERGRYAMEVTKKILPYYNQYFGVKYPLPKLDQIAVPGGFQGAMENWGGITYNERVLLFDPKTSSPETKQRVFSIVAHEMAHQWFGNLVTMAWWDNLWLNEGFASWMAAKATDHFNPDWQVPLGACLDKSGVMGDDARSATHPIQRPVKSESQANDAFDHITYRKGQAFLRMLESYLGADTFRDGIQHYMARHKYGSTTTADLWSALGKVSKKPVQELAACWTEQPGLPLVKATAECVDGKLNVSLEQERFTVQDPEAQPLEWKIPVALMDKANVKGTRHLLLDRKSATVSLGDCNEAGEINVGAAGYYRVLYSKEMFQKILQNINQLAEVDRVNLLGDSWALVEANRASATSYLTLAESMRNDRSWAVWSQITSVLEFVDSLMKGEERSAFRRQACNLLRPQLNRLGWDARPNELITDTLLRGRVIALLGQFGDREVIEKAQGLFNRLVLDAGGEGLAADLRSPVFKIVGMYADKKTYDAIHTMARSAKGTEERQLCYRSMAGALDPELAKETLAISLTDETVPQEATRLVVDVAQAGEHTELAWTFAQKNIKQLLSRVEAFRRNNYMPQIAVAFSDESRAVELVQYVKLNVSEEAVAKAKEAAATIRLKAELKKREIPFVNEWVNARFGATKIQ